MLVLQGKTAILTYSRSGDFSVVNKSTNGNTKNITRKRSPLRGGRLKIIAR